MDARFEAAKEDARRVDAEIAAAVSSSIGADSLFKERPLLGIPFTAKDCFNVKGLSWEDFQMTSFNITGDNFCQVVTKKPDKHVN